LLSVAFLASVQRFSYVSGAEAALTATSSIPQIAASTAFGITVGSIVVLWKGLRHGSKRLIAAGLSMFAVAMALSLVGGMKEPVIAALFALAGTYRLARGRLPRGSLLAAALVGLFIFAFINPYRTGVRLENLSVAESLLSTTRELASDTEGGILTSAANSTTYLTSRARTIDSLALIIARTPTEIPHREVAGLPLEMAAMFVPRSLWPEKPPVSDGFDFAVEYAGQSPNVYNSFAVTLVGDSYRYGGLLGVVAVALMLGAYLAVLDRLIRPLQYPAALVMLIALALDLAQSENGIAVTVVGQARTAAVVGIIMVLVIRRTSTGSENEDFE
jgi:hypothetical protein